MRWRLAFASAGLTMAILVVFGGVIGTFFAQRVRDDFDRELRGAVNTLAGKSVIGTDSAGQPQIVNINLSDFALANDATVAVYDSSGRRLFPEQGPALPASTESLEDIGPLRVATAGVRPEGADQIAGFVQYGRDHSDVDSTIERLWLFIIAGVLGGTLLATFAGLAIADRAMRPISSLTATAGRIASTRDPSLRIPQPDSDDEVAELAKTLENMLRALDSAQAERQAVLERQREFVADASHELRTPLTSVLANLELLQASLEAELSGDAHRNVIDPGERGEIVASALRSSKRMGRLVSDLLLLARADAGRSGEHRPCDLADIARSAVAEVASIGEGHEIEVHAEGPAPVSGNADELHRLVLNLLENAVHHTPASAAVELSIGRSDDGGVLILDVADDGPGVPEDMRDQVFGRFVTGFGPTDASGKSGTGLGLAIVRAVADSHGGEVSALESPSGGALFRVRIPAVKSQEPLTEPLEAL